MELELVQMGFSVHDTSRLGEDFPDLVIGKNGITALVEAKTPRGKKTAEERSRPGQKNFALNWRGSPVIVAYTAADVAAKFKLLWSRQ